MAARPSPGLANTPWCLRLLGKWSPRLSCTFNALWSPIISTLPRSQQFPPSGPRLVLAQAAHALGDGTGLPHFCLDLEMFPWFSPPCPQRPSPQASPAAPPCPAPPQAELLLIDHQCFYTAKSGGQCPVFFSLEPSAAFDTVAPCHLLAIILSLGFKETTLAWSSAYPSVYSFSVSFVHSSP